VLLSDPSYQPEQSTADTYSVTSTTITMGGVHNTDGFAWRLRSAKKSRSSFGSVIENLLRLLTSFSYTDYFVRCIRISVSCGWQQSAWRWSIFRQKMLQTRLPVRIVIDGIAALEAARSFLEICTHLRRAPSGRQM